MLKYYITLILCLQLILIESRVYLPVKESILDYDRPSESQNYMSTRNTGCRININKDLTEPQPLILSHNTVSGEKNFVLPENNTKGYIFLNSGQTIEFHCNQGFNHTFEENSVTAVCLYDTLFAVNYTKYNLRDIYCARYSRHTTRNVGSCSKNGTLVEIGYEIPSKIPDINNNYESTFLKLFDVCFNNIGSDNTLYSHNILSKVNIASQKGVNRPNFITGRDYFLSQYVDRLYSKKNQLKMLSQLLSSEVNANQLITDKQFLTRGHLTPKVDMVLATHQRATFYFINVAPQWMTFNAGNWARIEDSVRSMVAERDIQADIYTGTHGVIKYDVNGIQREFYLNYDENNNGLIPVPKIYYKIVIDQISNKGVALIGVNNPYLTEKELKEQYIYCQDVSDQIKWIRKIHQRISDGFYYACNVNEFAEAIGILRELNVSELLV